MSMRKIRFAFIPIRLELDSLNHNAGSPKTFVNENVHRDFIEASGLAGWGKPSANLWF